VYHPLDSLLAPCSLKSVSATLNAGSKPYVILSHSRALTVTTYL
jgi:hypothetical protein